MIQRRPPTDRLMPRAAAGALLVLGPLAALLAPTPARAQTPGAPMRVRDTVFVRDRLPAEARAQVDSITVLFKALDNEPLASPAFAKIRRQLEELTTQLTDGPRVMLALPDAHAVRAFDDAERGGGILRLQRQALPIKGWIGINTGLAPLADTVHDGSYFVRYFDYPSIVSVEPNSPAEQAGIAAGDVLVAYNGLDVVGRWINVSDLLRPERKLDVTVRRDGDRKEFALVVAHAPMMIQVRREPSALAVSRPAMPGEDVPFAAVEMPGFARSLPALSAARGGMLALGFAKAGLFGASLATVTPALGRALKIATGVLVEDVEDQSPASVAGLRAGDVIVSANGTHVTSLRQLMSAVSASVPDHGVRLDVMRGRARKQLSVTW